MQRALVYTETTVFSPPEKYAEDAPYQLAIVELADVEMDGERITVRILGVNPADRVRIGDEVVFVEEREGVRYVRKLR